VTPQNPWQDQLASWLCIDQVAGQMLVLFEVLMPFSIFVSFNGWRVWG
jgi:hypothetical protein